MTFAFSKAAEAELFDAVKYYEQQQTDLDHGRHESGEKPRLLEA